MRLWMYSKYRTVRYNWAIWEFCPQCVGVHDSKKTILRETCMSSFLVWVIVHSDCQHHTFVNNIKTNLTFLHQVCSPVVWGLRLWRAHPRPPSDLSSGSLPKVGCSKQPTVMSIAVAFSLRSCHCNSMQYKPSTRPTERIHWLWKQLTTFIG